jgi:hypothetical protein
MLDKIPAETRHIVIMLLAAVLGWASDNVLNLGLNPLVASLAGVVISTLVLWVTPLTRQYGIGKSDADDLS